MPFIVAVTIKEAEELARDCPELMHVSRKSADDHLRLVQQPPTDPYYAAQYKVYSVKAQEQDKPK